MRALFSIRISNTVVIEFSLNNIFLFVFFVQHESSNNVRVKLKRLTLKSSGLYRCEVSAEAPNFSSAQAESRMEVICKSIN